MRNLDGDYSVVKQPVPFFFNNRTFTGIFFVSENTAQIKQQKQGCGTSLPGYTSGLGCLFGEGRQTSPRSSTLAGVEQEEGLGNNDPDRRERTTPSQRPLSQHSAPLSHVRRQNGENTVRARRLSDGPLPPPCLLYADNFTLACAASSKTPSMCGSSVNIHLMN